MCYHLIIDSFIDRISRMHTQRGLEVTTGSIEAVDSINYFHEQVLSSGQNAIQILDSAKKHTDNLLIQTYATAFYLYAQEDVANEKASDYLQSASRLLTSANEREKLIFEAVTNWSKRDYANAISLLVTLLERYPRDTLALKFMEWLFYCTGQAFNAEYFLKVCDKCAPENQDESHFLAIHSFALELCGQYSKAREMAEEAITMNLLTPWAHHTLAHVHLLTSDITGGINRLRDLQKTWEDILPLLKGHNTWHLALFYLANRNEEEVKKLYPHISGALPDTVLEQLDTISLLWRMDMAGLPQDRLLNQVVDHLSTHPLEYYTGFTNAHFIYCLVKSGYKNEADESLKRMKFYACSPSSDALWGDVVLPLCQGIYAFADADYKTALMLMEPVIGECAQLGGSDAQIELFFQTYLLVLIHTKQKDKALQFFTEHLKYYNNTPLSDWWFQLANKT
ncbi:TPA: tetratricopeptide repeat protein [Legionella pneumophila subsp. pneumophila]|nr:tetratricopeptide repeat protein [Legionella pneumophila subsp. pneumophila]HAT9298670.1 tetratricopeptide repeat protein [Legionella pneumophila subsp. pneumophila]HAT9495303.1 tetratricopeptide repeat protein [Legionella pneumophila subsp. pneumophila]